MNIFMILTIIVGVAVYIIHGIYYYESAEEVTQLTVKYARNPEEYIEYYKYVNILRGIFWPLYVAHISYLALCTTMSNKHF